MPCAFVSQVCHKLKYKWYMENQNEKSIRKLITTLKMHQKMLNVENDLHDYLKESNTSNYELMVSIIGCIESIEKVLNELKQEAKNSDGWNYFD